MSKDIKWTHIAMRVKDFEKSINFYRDYCGLDVVRDRRKENNGGTVWLGRKTLANKKPLFLLVLARGKSNGIISHFGFQCSSRKDIDEIAKKAKTQRILVHSPTYSGGIVGYWNEVKDPDGNIIEFTHGQPIKGI